MVAGNVIGDVGVAAFAEVLQCNPSLVRLFLGKSEARNRRGEKRGKFQPCHCGRCEGTLTGACSKSHPADARPRQSRPRELGRQGPLRSAAELSVPHRPESQSSTAVTHVGNNGIREAGASAMAAALAKNQVLSELDLSINGNNKTQVGTRTTIGIGSETQESSQSPKRWVQTGHSGA
jgi:hypothetical protein